MRIFSEQWTCENIARWLQWKASFGTYDGIMTPYAKAYTDQCKAIHKPSGTILLFTRDEGMHESGWWKNPDYERCLHLSLSFRDPKTGLPRSRDKDWTDKWIEAFFPATKNLIWAEPPYSPEGKKADVWHYRVFYAPGWIAPILPRKEVYSKDFTPAHWLSYSDLQAKLEKEAAEKLEREQ